MRADWNQRARRDPNYYAGFGRRGQADEEFFASAAPVIRSLEPELKRLPLRRRRALEIGCGPGRLLRPMSRHFEEIHGVDVSDEMIALARERLRDVPQARLDHTAGSDLRLFPGDHFDFIYSYAVFQHIPSREVIFAYLAEAQRVLRPGGILRCQLNGLRAGGPANTWEGARISAAEVLGFARARHFSLLAIEGAGTQYMWTTWRKPRRRIFYLRHGRSRAEPATNAYSGEPVAPCRGPYAALSIRLHDLAPGCDLNELEASVDGLEARPCYVGPRLWDGFSQINVELPAGLRTGMAPVELRWRGRPLCGAVWARLIPPGPVVPRLRSLRDGINLLSGARISSGIAKLELEEISRIESLRAEVSGQPVTSLEFFCADAVSLRYEVNFLLPEQIVSGRHEVRIEVDGRALEPVGIEVV